MECVTFHLQNMFRYDISYGLKKSNRVLIRDFVQWIECLWMPCLYYSSRTSKSMKIIRPFDDADLASHILRMVPRNWQDQYKLSGAMVPQSVRRLLEAMECIEKACPTNKDHEGPRVALKQATLPRGR